MAETEISDPLETLLGDEAEAEQSEAPEEAPVEGEAEEPGQPRDEKGQFVAVEEQSPDDGQAPEVEAPSKETPEIPADTEGVQAEAEVPAEPPKPFVYNADGQPHELEGSELRDDGVFVPRSSIHRLQSLTTAGHHHLANWQRERDADKQAVNNAKTEAAAEVEARAKITEQFEKLLSLGDDELYENLGKMRAQLPQIKADAERVALEARNRVDKERLAEFEAQEQWRGLEPKLQGGLETHILEYHKDERFKDLTQQDLVEVYKDLWQGRDQLKTFVEHEGQVYVNLPSVSDQMEKVARVRREAAVHEKKLAEAKATNKALTEESKVPPAVSAKTGPAPSGQVRKSPRAEIEKLPIEDQARASDDWFDELDVD